VLLTDSHLGTIRGSSLQKGLTQHPTVILQPSWIKTIEGLGVAAARTENVDHIEKSLAGWDKKGPLFLEIPFDADEYQHITDGIR
jgi:thiamine pyrophosphate-dependent acetolactate synthase large subunit-like protein